MTRRAKSQVGAVVISEMAAAGLHQFELARLADLDPAYISQVVNGHHRPSPGWLNTIASALQLSPERRADLHRAAARDAGYEIDLGKL